MDKKTIQVSGFAFLYTSAIQQAHIGRKWELHSFLLVDIIHDHQHLDMTTLDIELEYSAHIK